MYGSSAPPPPPMLGVNGSIPARRITTQPPQEMPSCVQNAMRHSKKPFSYTPGGLDLSQIKSPRMAQRISRNAQMEGVTNQPKPPQHNTNTGTSAPNPPPLSLGMPVQVFPQAPPPPPPAPSKQIQLNAANGNKSPSMQRKSPQPQTFEPPPFGFRPEIKIPSNPMAGLRKVAPPKPKEIDWSEEFRKERSKSPMPGASAPESSGQFNQFAQETRLPDSITNQQYNNQTPGKVDSPINTVQQSPFTRQISLKDSDKMQTDQNNNFSSNNYGGNFNQNSPQQRVYSPFASSPQPNLPKPLSPVKLNQLEENVPIYVRSSQRATSPKPPTPQQESLPVSSFQRQPSLEQAQTPIYTRSPRNVTASPVKQFNQTTFSQPNTNDSTENYPIYVRSFQKQQAPPAPTATQVQAPVNTQQPLSTAQPFVSDPGRQYYQPNRPANSNAQSAQMPPWMKRSNSKELPEWANNSDELSRPTAPQTNQPTNQQINTFSTNSNYPTNGTTSAGVVKERVVPIKFEQSPTKTPTSPGFTAQPYQSTPPQYNRVQPPPFAPAASNYASTYNDPHKFVDQGYNNVQNWDISQRVASPTTKSNNDGSRVIPIKLEDGHPYLDGPVSQSPHIIQSDARSIPNQSKSFRVLQQITDTMKMDPNETTALQQPAELHQPHYSRPLGPQDMNEHQLRKMKLNEDSSKNSPSFEARFKRDFPDWVPCKPHSVLQSVMRPDNDGPGYTDL